jgi:acyl carrier protein
MPGSSRARDEVRQIVARIAELPADRIADDATLESLGIDSLNGLRIVVEVEKRYGIEIPEAEIGRIRSMPDIFALVDAHEPGD